jgi:hypothetical protein
MTQLLYALEFSLDLLHKSEKGEAFADKNPDFTDKFGRKCFAPTAKNRLLQEVYSQDLRKYCHASPPTPLKKQG